MSAIDTCPEVVVETAFGRVRGGASRGIHFFKGVPYGDSTGGKNRFLPPLLPRPWNGTLDVSNFGPRAPQQKEDPYKALPWRSWIRSQQPTSEACLVLNVYTPAVDDHRRRPVFLYIHGGGFNNGSGCAPGIDGTNLAARGDMVVVTINHRLNVLGHLYLGGTGRFADAGNNGILDIVAALHWVRENIAAFGGDPHNVTIAGESGGGSKVAVLMATPLARGLFHRAVIQSASSLLRMATPEEAARCTDALLRELNVSRSRLDALQDVPLDKLMAARKTAADAAGDFFRPVVDGRTLPVQPFSPDALRESASIPLLIGSCEEELAFPLGTDPKNFSMSELEVKARAEKFVKVDSAHAARLVDTWRRNHPAASPSELMISLFSDFKYRRNVIRAAELRAAQGSAPTFMYLFTWKTKMLDGLLKSPHTMCLAFCFGNVDVAAGMLGTGPDVHALKERVMDAWIAFARNGDPNHSGLPAWSPYSTSERSTMLFDNQCTAVDDPKKTDRLALERCPTFVPEECRREA